MGNILVAQAENKPSLRLITADQLEQYSDNNKPVKKLTGNIHFKKGEVDLFCEEAFWYEFKNRADFYKDVVVKKNNQTLTADSLVYYTDKNIIDSRGKPKLQDSATVLYADRIKYFLDQDLGKAFGNVKLIQGNKSLSADQLNYHLGTKQSIAVNSAKMVNDQNNTILASDSLIYNTEKEAISAYKNPVLTKIDPDSSDTTKIYGNYIQGTQEKGNFTAEGDVRIVRDNIRTTSKRAHYTDSSGTIDLFGEPRVFQGARKINGEKIQARLDNNEIKKVLVKENAIASTLNRYYLPRDRDTSQAGDSVKTILKGKTTKVKDEITGQEMKFYFKEGEIDSIRVIGMATSFYNVAQDSILRGYNKASGDTIAMRFVNSDSARKMDRISIIRGAEGRFVPHETNTEMDTTVKYSSERIDYYIMKRENWLIKNAKVEYKDMKLTAGKINVLWNKNLLVATPFKKIDPTGDKNKQDSIKGIPKFTQEGSQPFKGEKMIYNLETRRGRIVKGKSHSSQAYYHGKKIMKTKQDNTYYIQDGKYTTCDLDHPHYYFKGQKMKIIHKDWIIARPLVLYIYDIPVIGIPFAVVPKKGGNRRSGWIMPSYADSKHLGPYLKGLGYFWAINDYTDLKLTADFFTNRGVRLNYQSRYKLRYRFNGNISGFYEDRFLSEKRRSREYKININHHHNLSPTMNLDIDASFLSEDNYYQKHGINLEDRLQQQIVNRANFTKSWRNLPYSFSAGARQTINLQAKQLASVDSILQSPGRHMNYIKRNLPTIRFNHGSEPIFPSEDGEDRKWYNEIYFGFDSEFQGKQKQYFESVYEADSSLSWHKFKDENYGMSHNFSLNSSQNILSYFSISENLNINEDWIFEYNRPKTDQEGNWLTRTEDQQKLVTEKVNRFLARHTGSASMSIQTKLYGLFPFNIGPLKSIRHIATPNVGLSYNPDFSKNILGWNPGYIMSGADSAGNKYRYDLFQGSLYGQTSTSESRSLNFNISNVFQAKVKGKDKMNKIKLFNVQMSSGYNFAADSLKLQPLRSSLRTTVGPVNISMNATHQFYATRNGRTINEYYNTFKGLPLPKLNSLRINGNTDFTLQSKTFQRLAEQTGDKDTSQVKEGAQNTGQQSTNNLWKADFGLRYLVTKTGSGFDKTFSTSFSAEINLSENWSIGYRADFDLIDRKVKHQSININRDLHCWELSFDWTPGGYGRGYVFRINVKASALRDLKYEEKSGRVTRVTGIR